MDANPIGAASAAPENPDGLSLSGSADVCICCGRPLDRYGAGATKRFLNRGADRFYCTPCLAQRLKVSHAMLLEKIEVLKKQGCTLFV